MNNIKIDWDNEEKSVVRYEFKRGWNWQDLHQALNNAHDLIDTVTHRVDVIMDFREASMLPSGALTQLNMAYQNPKHENIGVTILLSKGSFVSSMVHMAQKIWGRSQEWELEVVSDETVAYEKIADYKAKHEVTTNSD